MKKLMRLLAAVLALTMLCEMLPLAAFAQSDIGQAVTAAVQEIGEENSLSGSCGENATWEVDYSTRRLTISGTGAMEDYSYYDKAPWYKHMYYISRVVIQKGITSIGKNAFGDCEYLTGVTIPEGVESIGDYAFWDCKRLRGITIPDGVTHIGRYAFDNCVRLVDITLPESATSIGEGAFEDCDAIENIALPSGMTSIAADTFSSCGALKNIVIPDGVTSIGERAFNYCGLTDIMIPENVEYIGREAFCGCEKLESIVIPDGITSIGDYTFCECNSLTDITLPESVESIGKHAFEKSAITNITLSDNVTSIGESAFEKSKLTNIEIPDGVTRIENNTFYACDTLTDVMFSADITFIGSGAFAQCKRLTDVYYGGSEEKWKEIDISFSNDPLINATIHYQDGELNQKRSFEFDKDNLSFLNSSDDFFALEEKFTNIKISLVNFLTSSNKQSPYCYQISEESFGRLTNGLTARAKTIMEMRRDSKWGGSCEGMARLVALHYLDAERIPLDHIEESADSVYDLSKPKSSSSVRDIINYYYLMQFLPSAKSLRAQQYLDFNFNFENVIQEIVQSLQKEQPVLVSIMSESGGAHTVILLNILSKTDTEYTIRVYDPNAKKEQELKLYTDPHLTPSTSTTGEEFDLKNPKIEFKSGGEKYNYVQGYILGKDIEFLDLRNYFQKNDYETSTDYNENYLTVDYDKGTIALKCADIYARAENGKLVEKSTGIQVYKPNREDDTTNNTIEFAFPKTDKMEPLEFDFAEGSVENADILLGDTLLSVSSDGPVKLTYDESARTVDVSADDPTAVSLLMTQNTVNDSWPWHSWAVDTTGTTTLHAELDSEGLHLTGDGLTNAKYATENADTEQTSKGTINVQPDETGKTSVTIINKNDGDTDDTEVKGEDKAEETTYTVTVSGGTASPAKAKEGETVTITAEKTDTFQNWTVVAGGITLENENLPTTTFTMGKENVVITANYSSGGNITPPRPGEPGQSPSDDGGAGIVLAIGAAATVAAGIGAIALMPVKVEGKVELADHTALPGAKIALLQNGKVVAQTTTDANGKFALKVKRGSYELTAAYTDANGRLMHKTASFKAPAKNLTVTF